MQSERWRHLEQLYHAAMEQPEDQRAAFLESSCAGDLALRKEVASLIAYSQQDGRIIDESAVEVVAAAMADDLLSQDDIKTDKMIGTRVAQYRLIEKLGAGGMGDVYRAVRADNQYEKRL